MNLQSIKENLNRNLIFLTEGNVSGKPTVVGYEKVFKMKWLATQLNTFVVASDMGDEEITVEVIKSHLSDSFHIAKKNYDGWPRGLQSGLAVISILISNNISSEAKEYCQKLKTGKQWAGFSVPIVYDSGANEIFEFKKKPMWGRIYYPHIRKLIGKLK